MGLFKQDVDKEQRRYFRATRGRRWLLRMMLWFGALLTVIAGMVLGTGRRLQSR